MRITPYIRPRGRSCLEGWVVSARCRIRNGPDFRSLPGRQCGCGPVARSDVADHFKKGSLLMCGYRLTIPAGTLALGLSPIQLVGLRNDQYYRLPAALYVCRSRDGDGQHASSNPVGGFETLRFAL